MLKLVESLEAKAERAKRTTVEYLPSQEGTSHHYVWCGLYAKGKPKGWHRYKALDASLPGGVNGSLARAKNDKRRSQGTVPVAH
jgi:hypothetical protein